MSAYVSDNEQAYSQMAFSIQENSGSAVLAASFSGADLVLTTLEQNYFTDGSITLKLVVDDLGGFLDTTEVNVNILSVNDMPLILAYAGADSLDEDGSLTLSLDLFNVEDVDNSYPNDFTLDISTGDNYSLSNRTIIIPDLNYNGPLEIIVLVNDGELNSEPFTFQIEVASVNDPPVIISQVTLQITEDSTLTLTLDDLIFEDVDHTDDDMTILLGDGIDYSADNTTITPALNFTGDLAVPVVLFDGQDSSNVFSLVIQVIPVNDAPAVVDPLADIVVDEDSESLSFSLSGTGGIPYFDDPDIATGDLLSYSAYSADDGLITVLLDADSVYVDFLPDSNGVDTLFITATDLGGLSGMDTILVTVNSVNDAPVIISQVTLQITEDSTITLTLDELIFEDADHTVDGLTIFLGEGNNYSVDNTTITPAPNFIGDLAVPVVLFDGQDSSNVFSLVIQVIPVNDAPAVVNPLADIVVDEDSESLAISLTGTDGAPYFDDPDIATGDLLSYSAYSAGDGLITVLLDADSVYVDFLPDSNGVDTLFITALDLGGLTGTDTIPVTVNSVNDVPIILGSTEYSIIEDSNITLSVDSLDIIDVDSEIFTLAILPGDNYTYDELVVSPEPNYYGTLIVSITVSDGDSVSTPFNLNIVVVPVNDTPLPFDLLTPANGTEVVITLLDIMSNTNLEVSWSSSFDADEDEITYSLKLGAFGIDTVLVSTPDTSHSISYELLTAILDSLGTSQGQLFWTVFVTDGIDTINANSQFSLNVNADNVLGIDELLIPDVYALHQNYPNPFNPTTTLKYDLPENAYVTLKIYDIMGREVIALFSNGYQEAGYRSIQWNGLNQYGKPVGSGMYFYMIKTTNFTQTRKMIMLK